MKALRLLLTALALSLAGATAALGAAPTASARGIDLVITVRSIETSTVPTDKAPSGPSKGDRFVIRDNLLNVNEQFGKRARVKVGTDVGTLTMTSKTEGVVVGTATLPGGSIRFHGVLHFKSANAPFKVDGGTGKYVRAQGFLVVGSGANPLNVYHLRLPEKREGTVV
jgi:hypothetical protein